MRDRVRLGLLGAGRMGRTHLERAVRMSDVTVAAVADPDRTAAHGLTSSLGLDRTSVHVNLASMLSTAQLDCVVIAGPPQSHVSAARRCLDAGVPFLLEKPVAPSLDDARGLAADVAASGLVATVGYQMRHSAAAEQVATLVGYTGPVMAVVCRITRRPEHTWYEDPAKSGGQLTEMATHQIDLLRLVLGRVIDAYSRPVTAFEDAGIESGSSTVLTFENGSTAMIGANLMVPAGGKPPTLRGTHFFAAGQTVSLLGDEGSHREVTFRTDGGTRSLRDEEDLVQRQLRAFVASVRAGRVQGCTSLVEGLRTLAVTDACRRSMRSGVPETPVTVAGHALPTGDMKKKN